MIIHKTGPKLKIIPFIISYNHQSLLATINHYYIITIDHHYPPFDF